MTRRIRKAAVSLVVAVATAAAAIAAADGAGADPTSSSSTVTRSPTTTTTESTTTATTTAPVTVTDLDLPDGVSVAVLDLTDADTVVVGDGEQYDTASIVKVDIVAALLWQTGGDLTEQQRSLARAALTVSDNTAATTTLFEQIGGADGLDEFNAAIGLTDTSAGANGNWGLTQTTVSDQIRLLEVTLGDDASVLTEDSRDWLAAVMSQVVDGQDFGVTAAADDPEDAALKVGYLQRTATGRWDVTSIGRIESGGHTLLVAVLAHDQATMSAGVAAIEQATVSAVSAIS